MVTERAPIQLASLIAHEAGHAVTAWFCTSTRLNKVWIHKGGGTTEARCLKPVLSRIAWEHLIWTLGGIAGQFNAGFTTRGSTAEQDLTTSLRLAQNLVMLLLFRDRIDAYTAFPIDTADRNTITQMFHEGTLAEDVTPPVRHVLEAAYLKARVVLRTYDLEFRALRIGLEVRRELSAKDVLFLIGSPPNSTLVRRSWLARLFRRAAISMRILWWLIPSPAKLVGRPHHDVAPVVTKNVSHDSSSSSSNTPRSSSR